MIGLNGITPPPPRDKINKKQVSIRLKLLLVFGILIIVATSILGILSIVISRKAIIEKIETHLIDKASDTAEILNGRINAFFQFAEGIARMPILRDKSASRREIALQLQKEAKFQKEIEALAFVDSKGSSYFGNDNIYHFQEREWFQKSIKGNNFISSPYISKVDSSLVITISVPVYNDVHEIIGVLMCDIYGLCLSDKIKDIVIGETGNCYVIDNKGATIADPDEQFVRNRTSSIEMSKTDSSQISVAEFEKRAINEEKGIGFYTYRGVSKIAAFSKMKMEGWSLIVSAPINEFMRTIQTLQISLISIGVLILLVAVVIIYFIANEMVKPVKSTVLALQGIAQGEGDLTVRLPLHGND
ncbi:MAG: cache domain-containing protein, partial [Treponema sp.]